MAKINLKENAQNFLSLIAAIIIIKDSFLVLEITTGYVLN